MHAIWQTVATSASRLSTAHPAYAAAAAALYIASLFIAGARWRGFLRALGAEAGVIGATLATLGGIAAGNLLPPPGGEAVRIALLRTDGRSSWRQATVAAAWDRVSELPPILVLAVMASIAARSVTAAWRTTTIAVAAGVAAAAIAIAVRHLRRSPAWTQWRTTFAGHQVAASVFAAGVGYSSLLWLQDVLRLLCVTLAFGVALSPTRIAALSMIAMLGGVVPGIAGLGPVEGGLVAGLIAFGVDVPTAAAITALERAISWGFSTAAGAVVIARLGGTRLWHAARQRHAPDSDADAARS